MQQKFLICFMGCFTVGLAQGAAASGVKEVLLPNSWQYYQARSEAPANSKVFQLVALTAAETNTHVIRQLNEEVGKLRKKWEATQESITGDRKKPSAQPPVVRSEVISSNACASVQPTVQAASTNQSDPASDPAKDFSAIDAVTLTAAIEEILNCLKKA